MNYEELDLLDHAVLTIEGEPAVDPCVHDQKGNSGMKRYQPTRDSDEALRLMDKHITKIVKVKDGWAAVGLNGRACLGATLPIAICVAIVENH